MKTLHAKLFFVSNYLRDRAFVLSLHASRERDAWVSLWTEHYGRQEAFVTGIRTATSKQRAHLQPFACIQVMLAEGKQFQRVAVAQMTSIHGYNVRAHPVWSATMGAICRLCETISAPQDLQEDASIFTLLLECIHLADQFPQTFSPERALFFQAFFLERFAQRFGYGVSLQRCARCSATPISCSGFLVQEGGFLCASCEQERLPKRSPVFLTEEPTLRKLLTFLEQGSLADALRLSAPKSIFRDLALIYEAMLTVLPVKTSPVQVSYLQSFYH